MTKRPTRGDDGNYRINGSKYPNLIGSRIQVFNGNAYKTEGGLTKNDLVKNKWSRIVSRKKYVEGKKHNRLLQYGYSAKKGKFGYVRVNPRGQTRKNRKSRRVRGGSGEGGSIQSVIPANSV